MIIEISLNIHYYWKGYSKPFIQFRLRSLKDIPNDVLNCANFFYFKCKFTFLFYEKYYLTRKEI